LFGELIKENIAHIADDIITKNIKEA